MGKTKKERLMSPIDAYIILAAFAYYEDMPTLNYIAMMETYLKEGSGGWEFIQEKIEEMADEIPDSTYEGTLS